mmetsp:Transcript_78081/g.224236  ORF Transcript_78081/g.224236 Transcript_78081/m.224236 type:complete len:290 (+) Transcript_78081:1609-2478(+)
MKGAASSGNFLNAIVSVSWDNRSVTCAPRWEPAFGALTASDVKPASTMSSKTFMHTQLLFLMAISKQLVRSVSVDSAWWACLAPTQQPACTKLAACFSGLALEATTAPAARIAPALRRRTHGSGFGELAPPFVSRRKVRRKSARSHLTACCTRASVPSEGNSTTISGNVLMVLANDGHLESLRPTLNSSSSNIWQAEVGFGCSRSIGAGERSCTFLSQLPLAIKSPSGLNATDLIWSSCLVRTFRITVFFVTQIRVMVLSPLAVMMDCPFGLNARDQILKLVSCPVSTV